MAELIGLVDRNLTITPKVGEVFSNRSFKYLSPSMKVYGDEFVTKMKLLAGLAIAIQDYGFNQKGDREFKNELYYLIDVNGQHVYGKYVNSEKSRVDFMYVISWLRQQDFYIKDYAFDSGRNGSQHIICLRLPFDIINLFLEGRYSEMYSKEFIERFIKKTITVNSKEVINPVFGVLSHSKEYIPFYLEQLNFDYGTTLKQKDINHHVEFDIPPLPKNEILRW